MSRVENSAKVPLFGAKWAFGLGVALVLGFAAVTASSIYDKAHLASLETVTEPTAVGDTAFVAPASRELGMTVVTFNSRPLHLADLTNVTASDANMMKAGKDDSNAFFIYTLTDPKSGKRVDAGVYYLKAANGQYLKVSQ